MIPAHKNAGGHGPRRTVLAALRGVPILARTAGLIGHLTEELSKPIGFALSYQATRNYVYDGEVPDGFVEDKE